MKLSQRQLRQLEALAARYKVSAILLFGSQVTGETHHASDIDLAVLPMKDSELFKELDTHLGFIDGLSQIFSSEYIDLANLASCDEVLRRQIAESHQLLVGEHVGFVLSEQQDQPYLVLKLDMFEAKIKSMRQDLDQLAKYGKLSYSSYLEEYDSQLVVERLLEKIILRAVEINYHLLKRLAEVTPTSYKSSFLLMSEHGLLNKKLARQLSSAASVRNVLVHDYDQLDPKLVFQAMRQAVVEFPLFIKQVEKLIKERQAA